MELQLTADFADHLMGILSSNLIISPTSLVATILCMHQNGIREEDLVSAQIHYVHDIKTHGLTVPLALTELWPSPAPLWLHT